MCVRERERKGGREVGREEGGREGEGEGEGGRERENVCVPEGAPADQHMCERERDKERG